MIYPLVGDHAAPDAPVRVPVAVTCRVLGFSSQAFYQWKRNPVSEWDWDDAHLTNAAVDLHAGDPDFGYRFIADELVAAGHRVSENRVYRLCTQQRLRAAGLAGSMGRVGACGDNAAMESFFALLQKTSSTDGAGPPAINCAWRSSPGSRRPTTADAGNAASVASHPSSLRPSTPPHTRPDNHHARTVNQSLGSPVRAAAGTGTRVGVNWADSGRRD